MRGAGKNFHRIRAQFIQRVAQHEGHAGVHVHLVGHEIPLHDTRAGSLQNGLHPLGFCLCAQLHGLQRRDVDVRAVHHQRLAIGGAAHQSATVVHPYPMAIFVL